MYYDEVVALATEFINMTTYHFRVVRKMRNILVFISAILFSSTVAAVPILQLDVEGGHYHDPSEDVVSDPLGGEDVTIYALAKGSEVTSFDINQLIGRYTLSIALQYQPVGQEGASVAEDANLDLGSFTLDLGNTGNNFQTFDVTSSAMTYGAPMINDYSCLVLDVEKCKNMPGHNVFDTYFYEFEFAFDEMLKAAEYNTQDDSGGRTEGGLVDTTANVDFLYYMAFGIDMTNMADDYELHFDLYHDESKVIAPFSHDASTYPLSVPEPVSIVLFGLGLAGLITVARRRQA